MPRSRVQAVDCDIRRRFRTPMLAVTQHNAMKNVYHHRRAAGKLPDMFRPQLTAAYLPVSPLSNADYAFQTTAS